MEPFINDDLTHSVVINPTKKSGGRPDMTYELLKDIGW
jgi:hypothetical protein